MVLLFARWSLLQICTKVALRFVLKFYWRFNTCNRPRSTSWGLVANFEAGIL